MDVVVRHVRQIKVDHELNTRNIDAAGGDVGRDEDGGFARAERLNRAVALALGFVAVDRICVEPVGHQTLFQLLSAVLGAREHQCQGIRVLFKNVAQLPQLASFLHEMHRLGDLVGSFARGRDLHATRVGQIGL